MKNLHKTSIYALAVITSVAVAVGLYRGIGTGTSSESHALVLDDPQPLSDFYLKRKLPVDSIRSQLNQSNLEELIIEGSFFAKGKMIGSAWSTGKSLHSVLRSAYERSSKTIKDGEIADSFILTIATKIYPFNSKSTQNIYRGYRGVRVTDEDGAFYLSPITAIVENEKIGDSLKQAAATKGKERDEWIEGAEAITFDTRQFYFDLHNDAPAKAFFRGQELISLASVTPKAVAQFESQLTNWLFANLHKSGRMTYQYYPSSNREASSNNMIRQWMASVALGRAAKLREQEQPASLQNIRYNLGQFYHKKDDFGFIEYAKKAKLGAAALALISIIESPERSEFTDEEARLLKLTMDMWQPSGRFQTFYKPAKRSKENSLHNFYPGETLLAWALLYDDTQDPVLLERSMKSFQYYKDWHLDHRNPAFIPWHTQAYYRLWTHTQAVELKDWIFEMNDWLVKEMQGKSSWQYPDTEGRFYNATKRYGKPHASATGVYLEGLIDAFSLARATGDEIREERYRRSILLGLRSSIQLQFRDSSDMFFSTNPKRLVGGMRTTVYNNVIRVDNVQHVLMAAQKIVKTFKETDYR